MRPRCPCINVELRHGASAQHHHGDSAPGSFRRAPSGVSLLEVLVAMAILAVILSSTAGLLSFGAERMGKALRHAECERIAASHVEVLLRSQNPPTSGSVRFNREGRVDAAGPYTSRWTVDVDHPIRGAARLVLTVDGGKSHEATITTYMLRSRR